MTSVKSAAPVGNPRDESLPVHFFTIVLNGEPFIRYHLDLLRSLPFPWHWHVIEGVSSLVHDTAWSVSGGGRVAADMHRGGLSTDGTSEYLDRVAAVEPDRISLYRPPKGRIWEGKREMVSAPLPSISEECLLWEIDADELWTAAQIGTVRDMFLREPDRTAAYYWCDYFVGPDSVITTRYNYGQNPAIDWLRTWRFRPGDRWQAHEPPTLVRGASDVGRIRPFLHDETERAGAVFQHFAYATESQVRFKEQYYGYSGALDSWRRLQVAIATGGPVRLGDYLEWVPDDTLADHVSRTCVAPIASGDGDQWSFSRKPKPARLQPTDAGPIVIDGVFFQDFSTTGIARVWRSLLQEWLKSGFARRLLFLDRGGCGPRLPGLRTRSLPRWSADDSAEDSLFLQRVCDEEGATLFVSTYYTAPTTTPTLMLVYDMIPERLSLDMSDPVWAEKRMAVEHASSYVCISENTRRDLLELEAASAGRPADVVLLGIDPIFGPASEDDVAAFRRAHGLKRPYVLMVGDRRGVDGYKNGELVFRGFGAWSSRGDCEIVCVGGHQEIEPDFRRHAPRVPVRRLSLSDSELRLAYAGAIALAYPSRYEGFGLPIAEAMACGCPVITTTASSVPEVAGEAAVYVDPDDPQEFARALDAIRDPARRSALVEAGLKRAERFSWEPAAEAYASLFDRAARKDDADEREARGAVWQARREAQSREQAVRRSRRRAVAPTLATARAESTTSRRLKNLALRHLPPWAIQRLRRVHAARSSGALSARRLLARTFLRQ